MSRPRKSAKLHALSGAYAHDPKRRRKDVEARGAIGPWCEWSTDPATVWGSLVEHCPAGAAADRPALEYATHLICEMRSDPAGFPASKGALLVGLLAKLGCLPASRLAMSLPDGKDNDDPAERFFAKR